MVPDYCEPLIGYRAWNWANDGAGHYLLMPRAVGSYRDWPPRSVQRSAYRGVLGVWEHDNDSGCGRTAPPEMSHLNSVGFYAFNRRWRYFLSDVVMGPGWSLVPGEVWLWGTVVVHEEGYRAEYAYPKRLIVTAVSYWRHGRAIAATYGIPVVWRPIWIVEQIGRSLYEYWQAVACRARRAARIAGARARAKVGAGDDADASA